MATDPPAPSPLRFPGRRAWVGLAAALALLVLVTQVIAVYTENINWDEFALFHRVSESLERGTLLGAGRPGLVPLLLMPIVGACDDAVAVVHRARLLWLPVTDAAFVGLFWLIARFLRDRRERWTAAALGLGSLALVPVVLRWSVQVRTDQPAIAAGLWAAVLLLGSRARPGKAVAAGILLGLGYLCTQKLLYVAALGAVLALADLYVNPGFRARRELTRALLCAAAMLVVCGAFAPLVSLFMKSAPATDVEQGLKTFAYYRATFGFRVYRAMVPSLAGQIGLGLLLVGATVQAFRRAGARDRALVAAWAVLAAGVAVGAFHAGAFPYFWMTLGIFPAVAIGLAWPAIDASLRPLPLVRRVLPLACATVMVGLGVAAAVDRVRDTQRPQRESLAYIAAEFPRDASGFSFEGALFCMKPAQRMPFYMGEQVQVRFGAERRAKEIAWFIEQVRSRPISFFISNFGIAAFPPEIRSYLDTHYLPAYAWVAVPGRRVDARAADGVDFDVTVPGRYVWKPDTPSAAVLVDERRVEAGQTVELRLGSYRLRGARPGDGGALLRESKSPSPSTFSAQPFYSPAALADFG
jgi:hypothetical protein